MSTKFLLILFAAGIACFAAIHSHKPASTTQYSQPLPVSAQTANAAEAVDARHSSDAGRVNRLSADANGSRVKLLEQIRAEWSSGNDAGRQHVLANLLPQLAALDPTAALAWATGLSDENEQRAALAAIDIQIAQLDPAQAIEIARQYHLDAGLDDLLPSLAVQWANKDLAGALAWAGDLPAGEQRNEIFARIVFVEAQTAPAEAGARVLSEIPAGSVQEEAVMTVIHQWSLIDMAGALAWVQQFPESSLKDRALAELTVISSQAKTSSKGPVSDSTRLP